VFRDDQNFRAMRGRNKAREDGQPSSILPATNNGASLANLLFGSEHRHILAVAAQSVEAMGAFSDTSRQLASHSRFPETRIRSRSDRLLRVEVGVADHGFWSFV
jgi:hypothetical protein